MRVPAAADNFRSSCLLHMSPTAAPGPGETRLEQLGMQQQDSRLQAKPQSFKHLKFCFSVLGSKEVASEVLPTDRRQKADGVSIEKIDCETVTPLKALVA